MRRMVMGVLVAAAALGEAHARRPHVGPDVVDRPRGDAATLGELGPLLAMHKDAIHAGLIWDGATPPKILFWMNNAEYRGTDLVDPDVGAIGAFRPEFQELVRGGFPFSDLLDGSIQNRYKPDIARDNTLIWDLAHSDALRTAGKLDVADLSAEDIALNEAAFTDAGDARGLHYNLFCAGHAALPDGRWLLVGGHDKGGNNGIRKLIIFDPATQTWAPMPIPPVKADYLADPTGDLLDHADPLDETNTDPPHSTDMTYQRWYPTAVTLPDGRVLIHNGTDQDTSAGPQDARFTKVRQATPEVFDPATGQVIALENARKLLKMYAHSFVVQTGPDADDWKVAVMGPVEPPLPDSVEIGAFDPFRYSGKTFLFDVQAALADPRRDIPGENHWELVATARVNHDEGASAALWELDGRGLARSQRVVLFGGHDTLGDFDETAVVESIDFSKPDGLSWRRHDDLVRRAARNLAVVLPDGQVLVLGGRVEDAERGVVGVTLEYQLFNPSSGKLRTVAVATVPRHDHSTAQLLPDGTVIVMGGNRGEVVPGDPDAGVPTAQIYRPPYLFRGARPNIEHAPEELVYGSRFDVEVSGAPIESVVMIRMEPVTHNWSWGIRSVKLAFDDDGSGRLDVRAPARAALAPPGFYMLFVVSADGVPSVARRVHLPVP